MRVFLILVVLSFTLKAAESPALEDYKKKYRETIEKKFTIYTKLINDICIDAYVSIQKVEEGFKKAGDLKGLLLTREILKETELAENKLLNKKSSNKQISEILDSLRKSKMLLDKALTVKLEKIKSSYLAALKNKMKQLTKDDKIEEAIVFNSYVSEFENSPPATLPALEGVKVEKGVATIKEDNSKNKPEIPEDNKEGQVEAFNQDDFIVGIWRGVDGAGGLTIFGNGTYSWKSYPKFINPYQIKDGYIFFSRANKPTIKKSFAISGEFLILGGAKYQRLRDVTQAAKENYALEFNAQTQLEEVSGVFVPTLKDTFDSITIELWIKLYNRPGNLSQAGGIKPHLWLAGFEKDYRIGSGSVGTLSFRYKNSLQNGKAQVQHASQAKPGFRDNRWDKPIHLAAVRDHKKQELRFYIDGELVDKSTYIKVRSGGSFEFCSGERQWGRNTGRVFRGWLDEARITEGVRYQANFSPKRRLESDKQTLALYHFDEGKGGVLKDFSGNAHHGKVMGAKWILLKDKE